MTDPFKPAILQSENITLLPIQESDFERLYAVAADPAIWEQHPTRDRYKRDVFKVFFDGALTSDGAFLVFETKTNELIGSSRYYDYNPGESSVGIGYTFLATKFWGGKYNRSMKKLMIDHAFQFVDTVLFHIGTSNIRSQKAILNIGATKVRDVDFDHYGMKVVHYEYAITKNDWINTISAKFFS